MYVGNLAWDVSWQDLKDHMRAAGDVVYADVMKLPDGKSKGCGCARTPRLALRAPAVTMLSSIVEYSAAAEARRAIETLHDSTLKGRLIFVREVSVRMGCKAARSLVARRIAKPTRHFRPVAARPLPPLPARRCTSATCVPPSRADPASILTPGGAPQLPYETAWQELKDLFKPYGATHADVIVGEDGRSKGFGIVQFRSAGEAQAAIRAWRAARRRATTIARDYGSSATAGACQNLQLGGRSLLVREDASPGARGSAAPAPMAAAGPRGGGAGEVKATVANVRARAAGASGD